MPTQMFVLASFLSGKGTTRDWDDWSGCPQQLACLYMVFMDPQLSAANAAAAPAALAEIGLRAIASAAIIERAATMVGKCG